MLKFTLFKSTLPLILIALIVIAIAVTAFNDRDASVTLDGSSMDLNTAQPSIAPLKHGEGSNHEEQPGNESAASVNDPQPDAAVTIEGFQLDASGRLLLGPQTRVAIETLAQADSADYAQEIAEINQRLPPVAAAQIAELATRFQVYLNALAQLRPAEQGTPTTEGALLELEALHNLRVMYLGNEATEAFYSEEEALNKEVARLIGVDSDSTRTPEDRISQADALRASLPLIAALEQRNTQGHPITK